MSIQTDLNYTYTSGADAVATAKAAQAAQAAGNSTTDRGTLITKSSGGFDKNSFLKILAAQLSNLDPTQNQDSSAYVAQMAQFAGMEQMQNLNTTMSDYAYQQMVGKTVILNEKDDSGNYITGSATEVIKKSDSTYLKVSVNGQEEEVDVKNIIGTVDKADGNLTANSRTALNSDFIAASDLASKNQNVVIATLDDNKNTITVKGKVIGAYIDTVNGATVKIKIDVLDDSGNSTGETKVYEYGDIVRAGDLTNDEMNISLNNTTSSGSTTGTTTSDSTTSTTDNSTTTTGETASGETINTISSATSDEIDAENATLAKIAGA